MISNTCKIANKTGFHRQINAVRKWSIPSGEFFQKLKEEKYQFPKMKHRRVFYDVAREDEPRQNA